MRLAPLLLVALLEVLAERARRRPGVHEVAVAAAHADGLVVLAAARLAEVRHGRELADERPARVEAAEERLERRVRVLLVGELAVDVADHVVAQVLADVELLDLAVAGELVVDLLVELVELLLDLLRVELRRVPARGGDLRRRVLVHVLHDHRLREGRLVVLARAPVAVAARADLEVERAVHLVLLGAVDAGEMRRAAARAAQLAVAPVSSGVPRRVVAVAAVAASSSISATAAARRSSIAPTAASSIVIASAAAATASVVAATPSTVAIV